VWWHTFFHFRKVRRGIVQPHSALHMKSLCSTRVGRVRKHIYGDHTFCTMAYTYIKTTTFPPKSTKRLSPARVANRNILKPEIDIEKKKKRAKRQTNKHTTKYNSKKIVYRRSLSRGTVLLSRRREEEEKKDRGKKYDLWRLTHHLGGDQWGTMERMLYSYSRPTLVAPPRKKSFIEMSLRTRR